MYEQLILCLKERLGKDAVRQSEPMKKYTTFRIGGPVDVMVLVRKGTDLQEALRICKEHGCIPSIIGNGSNLLVSDQGIRGVVIVLQPGELSYDILSQNEEEVTVCAFAGGMLSSFAREMSRLGYVGMEWAAGIPGSIGGAIVMNAGAYGGEIKDVLVSARVLTETGTQSTLSAEELQLSYRHSIVPKEKLCVESGTFRLKKGDAEASRKQIDELSVKRKEKQPLEFPSAGSTFKRPTGFFAGKLIQDAEMQGYRVGDAMVSEKHCGFVVNAGEATAVDVLQLITDVRNRVGEVNGRLLETEVRFLGDWSYLPESVDRGILEGN